MNDRNEDKSTKKPGMPGLVRLLLMGLFYGGAAYFAYLGDSACAVSLAIVGLTSFTGYRIGAVYLFGSLLALAAAIALAPTIGMSQENRFAEWFGTGGLANRILSVVVVGVVISLLSTIGIMIVSSIVFAKYKSLDSLNRWTGFFTGTLQGIAVMSLVLGAALMLAPMEREKYSSPEQLEVNGTMASKAIIVVGHAVEESRLGPTIAQYNPFERIPQLSRIEEVQESAKLLSDPNEIKELLQHPSIKELQQRPEVKNAVAEIRSDPELSAILDSGKPIDRDAAMKLMNHPTVLDLIDQPGFLDEASKIVKERVSRASATN